MNENLLRFKKDTKYCIFDAETFNLALTLDYNKIWQFGFIKVINEKIIEEDDIYIKWDTYQTIGKEAARITRFNPEYHAKRAITPELALDRISSAFDWADYIVGHNILGFDLHLVKSYYKLYNKDWKPLLNKCIDTNCLAKAIKLKIPYDKKESLLQFQLRLNNTVEKGLKTSLTAMGKEYNIEYDYDNLHNALNDIKLNLLVWNKIKWQIEI